MAKMTIRDVNVTGKRVLVRVDFNVPQDPKTGEITDDSRIRAAVPTIKYLLEHGARVILISHLGRPDGKVVEGLRLTGVAQRLSQILGKPVSTVPDSIGPEVEAKVAAMKSGDILLLENIRFHAEEEAGDLTFAKALAGLGDVYVNDAFGTSHRPHASITGIAKFLPAVAGFLVETEITFLGNALENPVRPFTALVGGAKISDKVKMLERISTRVDYLLVGGGMAATFLKSQGYEIGKSIFEAERIDLVSKLLKKSGQNGFTIILPVDVIVADGIDAKEGTTVSVKAIPRDKMIVDIGPQTIKGFCDVLNKSKTIFWNGPMGVYEYPQFAAGTKAMATLLASLKTTTVIGGGSTADIVTELGLAEKMTLVSTGGGASMSFVSGDKLPGVEVLLDKKP